MVELSIQYDGEGVNASISRINGSCRLNDESDGNQFNEEHTCTLTPLIGNQFDEAHSCTLTFDVQEDMEGPIFVYYQLDNFYQNHRRYVQSRSDAQLRGDVVESTTDCDPMPTTTGVQKFDSILDTPLSTDTSIVYKLNPCGLIANSLFNDMIWVDAITTPDGVKTEAEDNLPGTSTRVVDLMDQTGIAWQSDITTKFKNILSSDRQPDELFLWQNPNYRFIIPQSVGQEPVLRQTAWTKPAAAFGVQDEHFIVWMRTAGLPNFRKLYGRIDTDLKKGSSIEFRISSNFVVQTFDGTKHLVLSTTSWFGGRNPFLGIAYITVGSICMVLAILFFAKHKLSPRQLGDTRYLVWKSNQ